MTDLATPFNAAMSSALLDGRKGQTRRLATPGTTLFNGRGWTKFHKSQEWDWENAWVDGGPSPAGNAGPYLKLPWLSGNNDMAETIHRIYPKIGVGDRLYVCEAHFAKGYWITTGEVTKTGKPKRRFVHLDQVYFPNEVKPDHAPSWTAADGDNLIGWYPRLGRFMFRKHSRMTLIVTEVRIQRLQDISKEDSCAEGCSGDIGMIRQMDRFGATQADRARLNLITCKWQFKRLWDSINADRAEWDANPWVIAYSFDAYLSNIDLMPANHTRIIPKFGGVSA